MLKRFRDALDALYGDRIERVVLFGSRARGDAHEDSDYDIAVFLKDLTDRWQEFDVLADVRVDLPGLEKTLAAMPISQRFTRRSAPRPHLILGPPVHRAHRVSDPTGRYRSALTS